MRLILTLFFIFQAIVLFSMEPSQIIEKMQHKYRQLKTYSYTSEFSMYKGHKSTQEVSFYEGFTYRNEKGVYQKISDTEFIYGKSFSLRLDKKIKSLDLLDGTNINEFPVNLDLVLKNCEKITAEQKKGYYSITLIIKKDSGVPLSVMKMRIDDKNFLIEQLDLYFSTTSNFSASIDKTDFDTPHLKIKITDFTTNPKIEKSILDLDQYLKDEGSSYHLTEAYKGYQFTNNQTKTN